MGGSVVLVLAAAVFLGAACGATPASSKGITPAPGQPSGEFSTESEFNFPAGQAPPKPKIDYAFDQKKAWDHLIKQCDFGPRVPGTEQHKKCRDFIQDELKKSCDNVRLQELTHKWSEDGKTYTMWNILGEQNWKDAKVRIVLLAHWDTRPHAPYDAVEANQKKPILGANDGASGVAVLLELARAMKDRLPKDLGVLYLMTDGEDLGPELEEMFIGAKFFAKNMPRPKPHYGILLDMIGDKDLAVPVEPNSYNNAGDLVQTFYRVVRNAGFSAAFPSRWGPTIEDDHLPLIDAGVPTMDLIDFDYGPNHSWWHSTADTPDKCSANSLGTIGKALETWLLQSPVWKRASW